MVNLGTLPNGTYSGAGGVSADGSVVVGVSDTTGGTRAFRWTSAPTGMVNLGLPLDGGGDGEAQNSFGYAVSGNGLVAVGMSDPVNQAMRWTSAGMFSLGTLGASYSIAYAANFDGSVVVGEGTAGPGDNAFRWTAATGMVSLGTMPGGTTSHGTGVSANGNVVVGWGGASGFTGIRAFRWVAGAGGGTMTNLGVLPGRTESRAYGVSGDGLAVVGTSGTVSAGNHAILWTPQLGMVDLNTYLPTLGISLTGWTLTFASAISADGRTIIGTGTHGTASEAWIAHLPCAAPTVVVPPQSAAACRTGAPQFGITASGSRPFTYQWQLETTPGVWTTLGNDPLPLPCGGSAHANPPTSAATSIGVTPCPGVNHYQVRCIVGNSCGSATSNQATLTINSADFNGDGDVGTDSDIEAFFACLGGNCCAACGSADFNGDGDVGTDADIESFFRVLAGGAC
jgi:probable HAF family extracellular repeat protein